jgi:tRNA dimethylallyltransferase
MRVVEIFETSGKSIGDLQKQKNILLFPKEYFYHININPPKEILYKKCFLRFKKIASDENTLKEVDSFRKKYKKIIENPNEYSIAKTIGLFECIKYLNKEISFEEMVDISARITKNYAKRQYTWFNHQFEKFDLRIQ